MRSGEGAWVSYDGHGWRMASMGGVSRPLSSTEDTLLPNVGALVDGLFWPVEKLLTRPFRLPLKQPRLIDADIIGQELAEATGEDAADWWLTWQACAVADGVAGIWFALPSAIREAVDADDGWKAMPCLIVDATARLGAWLVGGGNEPLAVLDMDADGLFLGFRQGGAWLGMRRLNGARSTWDDMAVEAERSLDAMGWRVGEHAVAGRLAPVFAAALGIQDWRGEVCEASDLPDRHEASLAIATHLPAVTVNLRHGRWMVRRRSEARGAWRRPLALAAMLLLVWVLGTGLHLYRLSHREDHYRQQITAAFHRGLPHETVMLDALAQLRKAVGEAGQGTGGSGTWLRQLQAVGQVYRRHPWQLRTLDFEQGKMRMSGTVPDLSALNEIRRALSVQLGRNVELADTDLQGQKVAFRMNW